jgi:hypothetical protein
LYLQIFHNTSANLYRLHVSVHLYTDSNNPKPNCSFLTAPNDDNYDDDNDDDDDDNNNNNNLVS